MANAPIEGFVIELIDGGFLGMDGNPTDLQNARSFDSFEEARKYQGEGFVSEYVENNGLRELAYDNGDEPTQSLVPSEGL